jgi:hypothetical protein
MDVGELLPQLLDEQDRIQEDDSEYRFLPGGYGETDAQGETFGILVTLISML